MYYNLEESGKRIKKLRNTKGMKQEEIAEEVGIAQSTYARIEFGKKGASIDTLVALAQVLETTLDFIVIGKEEVISTVETMLVDYPEEKKLMVVKILKGIMENL